MKALTIHQPWASLIAYQFKRYETRSWSTDYRGALAIHAGKQCDSDFWDYIEHEYDLSPIYDLPLGAVLCIARLVSIHYTDYLRDTVSDFELDFGNFAPGRFAWELEVTEVFQSPILARGQQGLWEWRIGD